MNYFKKIEKLYPLLIGLIVFLLGFLYLIESNSLLDTDKASWAIFQQPLSSPIHHNHATHLMGIFELEEKNNRLEENDFLREDHLSESSSEDFLAPFFTLLPEECLLSITTLSIYLVDEQLRL